MTNTLLFGSILLLCGILGLLAGVAIPQRALMEPSIWLAAIGALLGASAPLVGLLCAIARRVFR